MRRKSFNVPKDGSGVGWDGAGREGCMVQFAAGLICCCSARSEGRKRVLRVYVQCRCLVNYYGTKSR